ncbi:4-hydroxyphenylpyruvate dioxygenase family protein [Neosynechococcus sphagnicola]|uniref:4-hydroxyphenylpyruvate dioxygenase family protein n=1 Tax=Neosynechococcus sphagnicola TaxID=1501145 RepID=UPI000AB0C5A5|nr:VOC family protein [Neosynechococcus sphagnicola]
MEIDHIHFFVEDARATRDWFVQTLQFQSTDSWQHLQSRSELIRQGNIALLLSSPLHPGSPVAQHLRSHPPGVADLAFRVPNLEAAIDPLMQVKAPLLQSIQEQRYPQGRLRWLQVAAWGSLRHTLVERLGVTPLHPLGIGDHSYSPSQPTPNPDPLLTGIDHAVLNVAPGDLQRAVAWYRDGFGFQPQQEFTIRTEQSGLYSQVMIHPASGVQLPINEPTTANSQIQEFLDLNQGAGIQHLALGTPNLLQAIAEFRAAGLRCLEVAPSYYTRLQQQQELPLLATELQTLQAQQILVDWQASEYPALLLQVFTHPIFPQPTFFLGTD